MATALRRSRQALTMLVVGLSAAGPGRAVAQQERNRDDPFARMEYFYRQRAYPLQRVPPGALQAARAAYGARWPAAVRAQRLQAASSLGAWAGFGPSPILSGGARYAGRVTSIAVGLSTSRTRSEEHTSELQSPCNLVCRLLLEKKKKHMMKSILEIRTHRTQSIVKPNIRRSINQRQRTSFINSFHERKLRFTVNRTSRAIQMR